MQTEFSIKQEAQTGLDDINTAVVYVERAIRHARSIGREDVVRALWRLSVKLSVQYNELASDAS